jgi:MscS family membrane protein
MSSVILKKISVACYLIAIFAVNVNLSAQEPQPGSKNTVNVESSDTEKAKGETNQKNKSNISPNDHNDSTQVEGGSVNKATTDDMVDHPIDTIKHGFDLWVSKHIKIREIEYWNVLYLFCGILIFMILARIARWVIEQHLIKLSKKTTTEVDDRIWEAVGRPVSLFIIAVGLYLSAGPLLSHLSPFLKNVYGRLCLATAATSVSWALYRLVSVIDHVLTKLAEKTDNNLDDLIVAIIRKSLKFTVVVLSVLFIGQNILAMNITALLAGAGVMGLAIAFAAQDTISNFFGSIMIILDQPFKVGDCIKIAGFTGSVENVGFRSTRIRTFDGHQISLPNKGVANDNIENVARRPFIKKVINLGLTYDTGYENMQKAITILHELLDKQPCMENNRLPRIVFDSFNDFSLNISVTIWWHFHDKKGKLIDPDYGEFMKWLHTTDMEILRLFDEAGLEFAFPTNTTYLAYDEKRKLSFDINKMN